MRIPLNIISVFVIVTGAALFGMVMGALFGYGAGRIGPDLFEHMLPWEEFEPVGVAVVLGAFGGLLCGAGLGVFAILVQLVSDRIGRRAT